MKKKTYVQFISKDNILFIKNSGEYRKTQFILLVERSDDPTLYAATIDSELSKRFKTNAMHTIKTIELVKEKGNTEKFLQILLTNGELLTFRKEHFCILFHFLENDDKEESYVLIVNNASLGNGAHYHVFRDDAKEENAIAFFWLIKDTIKEG